ncbi:hypothetical protein MCOR25_010528 [Pyricularia grisea]|uniref:Uncharacterized protein n=1 Tax=Pyricularia grisea TaxID=148305 RepID=A0A6P8AZV3_PYRGI|nr:hypothetical protein PgNI_10450 [Pyricularia grisea]KAI6350622.1 hypothetical protein MCOR25_010528 [Pyricularia grisea]TLD07844.1 hypothetical protein PgNI_10450 [Pyricularia grisea]
MGEANFQPTLLDLNFLRPGSLSLTSRGIEEEPTWQNSEIKTIELSLGLCPQPMTFRVRQFVPGPNDALSRTWVDPGGRPRSTPLAPYAVTDIPEAFLHIQQYIRNNSNCFVEVVRQSHPAVQLVYSCVPHQLSELRAINATANPGSPSTQADLRQLELLEQYSQLWFGIRNTVGSSWLCGSETLGMEPVHEEGYPLQGKISTPRQVVQTVGCLLDHAIRPLQARFLQSLRAMLCGDGNHSTFYTLFLVVRFSLPEYVVDLHKSAHFLVIHWLAHAAKAGVDFSSKHKLESSLGFLAESKRQAIVQSYAMIIDEACPVVRASPETWTQDLCFVSHMFGVPWEANAMYTGN